MVDIETEVSRIEQYYNNRIKRVSHSPSAVAELRSMMEKEIKQARRKAERKR